MSFLVGLSSQTDAEETILIGGRQFLARANFQRARNVTRNSLIVERQIQFTNIRLLDLGGESYSSADCQILTLSLFRKKTSSWML